MSQIQVLKCYHDFCPACPSVDKWLPDVCRTEGIQPEPVNVIERNAFATQLGVSSVPSVVVMREGTIPQLLAGARLNPANVRAAIRQAKEL